jgi:ribonuclease HI
MELKAVIEGLRALIEFCHDHPKIKKWNIFVYTDSKYVVDGMEQWVIDWKRRGWKKADNKAPENVDLWMELDKVAKDPLLSVKFSWVKGHAGHPQNEYCDEMCNKILDAEI